MPAHHPNLDLSNEIESFLTFYFFNFLFKKKKKKVKEHCPLYGSLLEPSEFLNIDWKLMFILPAPQSWFSGYTGLWPGFSVCLVTWQGQTFQKPAAQRYKTLFQLRILGLFSPYTWPTQIWEQRWLTLAVYLNVPLLICTSGNKHSLISEPYRFFIQK